MYSPIARSVVLRRRNQTIIDLLGKVFIHNAARSKLSLQMAKPCKERIIGSGGRVNGIQSSKPHHVQKFVRMTVFAFKNAFCYNIPVSLISGIVGPEKIFTSSHNAFLQFHFTVC